jgi:uncharacterized membrane protein YoaK (UPF0700 family)
MNERRVSEITSAASATNRLAKAAIGTTAPESRLLPVGLGFTAGFVDTLGFVALFSFFSAHVTGNFVVLGSALSQPVHGLIAKLLALPMFIISVAAVRLYGRSLERREHAAAVPLLTLQAIFLMVFMALGLFAAPLIDADAPLAILTALSGTVAMGVQNAASRTVFASLSPTTVMTGNVTQLAIDAVDLMSGGAEATLQPVRALQSLLAAGPGVWRRCRVRRSRIQVRRFPLPPRSDRCRALSGDSRTSEVSFVKVQASVLRRREWRGPRHAAGGGMSSGVNCVPTISTLI